MYSSFQIKTQVFTVNFKDNHGIQKFMDVDFNKRIYASA
jgi:hypothetical protein